MGNKKLYRSKSDRYIAGVCGGLAEYFEIDSLIIRIIFILLTVSGGSGLVIYIIMWILVPEQGEKRNKDFKENVKEGANKMAEEIKKDPKVNNNGRIIGGLVLIAVGTLFLLENFFPGFYLDFGRLWPLILVAIGLSLIVKS